MKTVFEIATPKEIEKIYLAGNEALTEQDKKEILADVKSKLESASDDVKRKSLIKVYILRGEKDKVLDLYQGISDRDVVMSVTQELVDSGYIDPKLGITNAVSGVSSMDVFISSFKK